MTEAVRNYLPSDWSYMNLNCISSYYELIDIGYYSSTYNDISSALSGNFNLGISKIVRVQNPFLYAQFLLRKAEYERKGSMKVLRLYHDTAAYKVNSIVCSNLDWHLARRVKYGMGISFSPCPSYANQHSSRDNATFRAMIIADVLERQAERVNACKELPSNNYDTTTGNRGNVHVKYYDDEFYPKYVAYYTSRRL